VSRPALFTLAAAWIAIGLPAASATSPVPAPGQAAEAMSLGSPRAPVTVIEYASVGCPHCAKWANDVFPELRSQYIDTGKVRFEFHEMLTGNPTLAAAGFLLARCAAPSKYFQVVDDVFARQVEIGDKGIGVLKEIGEHAGVTSDQFDACLQNPAALEALQKRTQDDAAAHGVTGTPTFFVGGEKFDGEESLDVLGAAIARAKH
jgi:protein-disulfide isomerase